MPHVHAAREGGEGERRRRGEAKTAAGHPLEGNQSDDDATTKQHNKKRMMDDDEASSVSVEEGRDDESEDSLLPLPIRKNRFPF